MTMKKHPKTALFRNAILLSINIVLHRRCRGENIVFINMAVMHGTVA